MKSMKQIIENRLHEIIDNTEQSVLRDAIEYSLMSSGKLIRPTLLLLVLRSYGIDYKKYVDLACAIEMIHVSSLIHDDLPALDNDDLRRGRPTNHKKFGESTAILAADALMIDAFGVIANCSVCAEEKVFASSILSKAAGSNGMLLGQFTDISYEKMDIELSDLTKNHLLKTGKLIQAPLVIGSYIANKDDVKVWELIGEYIGLSFQIQDDILDVLGDEEELGKPVNSDIANDKSTYVSILGIEKANELVNDYISKTIELVYSLKINHGIILEFIDQLIKRRK